MSIFKRIFDIARANVAQHIRIKPEQDRHTWRETEAGRDWEHSQDSRQTRDSSHHSSQNTQSRGASSNVDHQLAQHYASLEVPYGSDLATVKKSWKKLVRQYHPDLHSASPEKEQIAQELTQGLNKAYEAIEKHLARNNR